MIVRAQGFRPENFLFLVHEIIETLIAESYAGVHYDFLVPCLECLNMVSTLMEDFCIYLLTIQRGCHSLTGKNLWKMNFFPGQGKVREFCGWPGKFRKDLESQGYSSKVYHPGGDGILKKF